MADSNIREVRITVSDKQIIFTYMNKPDPNAFQQDSFKMELSVARIFHRVLNEYRKFEKKIFEKSDYEILGESLAKMLFNYPIVTNTLADPIIAVQRDINSRFRIYLDFTDTAGEVVLLPWEYLMLENLGKGVNTFFPAADKNSQFDLIRSITPADVQKFDYTVTPNEKLQVILIDASTFDYPVDKETRKNWFAYMQKNFTNDIVFYTIDDFVQENLITQLNDYINNIEGKYIVHYIGHAKTEDDFGYISLPDDNGNSFWLKDDEFAKLFNQEGKRKPHLVILQACYSGQITRFDSQQKNGLAMRLAYQSGIPAVVAMQNEITEEVGFAFLTKFYKSLVMGDDVAKATTTGRTYLGCVYKKTPLAPDYSSNIFGTPVIFLSADQPFALAAKPLRLEAEVNVNKICPLPLCRKIWKNVPDKKICGFNGCKGVLIVYKEEDQNTAAKTQNERADISGNNAPDISIMSNLNLINSDPI